MIKKLWKIPNNKKKIYKILKIMIKKVKNHKVTKKILKIKVKIIIIMNLKI